MILDLSFHSDRNRQETTFVTTLFNGGVDWVVKLSETEVNNPGNGNFHPCLYMNKNTEDIFEQDFDLYF